MKTTMKHLAAGTILALLLIVSNVHAEGKEATKASNLETKETTMQLENWMIDDSFWNGTSSFMLDESTDESLNLEEWMINDETWGDTTNIKVETDKESELELESWMTNSKVWNR